MNKFTIGVSLVAIALCSACGQPSEVSNSEPAKTIKNEENIGASIDLRVRDNDSAPYLQVQELTVPKTHEIGDKIYPFEGIGWENKYVGYRIYFDQRAGLDIFGKQVTAPSLASIEADTDYHSIADWGMDVLKVGPSRGIGGLGVIRNDAIVEPGPMDSISAEIYSQGDVASFAVDYIGFADNEGGKASVTGQYRQRADSPVTQISLATTAGAVPLATGIVALEMGTFFQSQQGDWHYIATYGPQSETKDNLGMGLLYRSDEASFEGISTETHHIRFSKPNVTYQIVAAWERDALGIKTQEAFRTYMDSLQRDLNSGSSQ